MTASIFALSLAQKAKAASAYRALIRSSKFTFNSDYKTYGQFLKKSKELFTTKVLNSQYLLDSYPMEKRKELSHPSSKQEIVGLQFNIEIDGVLQLAQYLTRNIVQGKHLKDGKRIALKFTDKTEIGDNSTIKKSKAINSSHSIESTYCSQPSLETPVTQLTASALERREKRRLNRLQKSHP